MKAVIVSRCAWTLFSFRANLIRFLRERSVSVIAAGAEDGHYGDELEKIGARFTSIPVAKRAMNPFRDLYLLFRLYRLYRREKPNVVHHFTIKPVIYGSLAARLAGVKRTINTITGLGYAFTDGPTYVRFIATTLYRFALKSSDLTFFQNPEDHRLFCKLGLVLPEKTLIVPGSGVDLERFKPAGSSHEQTTITVMFIGRLLEDKGIVEFLEAASLVQQLPGNVRFEVVGGLDARNPSCIDPELMAEYVDSGKIVWHSHTDTIEDFIARADVIVLPSYREGTPRVLLEAGAMGKPSIATDVPGCRDVVDHLQTGLLVPVKDPKALASAIRTLIEDPGLRIELGDAALRKVRQTYDEKIVIRASWDAYQLPDQVQG